MGNCQAAEAATVLIQHPDHKVVERIYWSVSANVVMSSNPGYYVAQVICNNNNNNINSNDSNNNNPNATTTTVKQLKLLRLDDALVLGQVYRLISFEDVLKGFAANKCVKSKEVRSTNMDPNNHKTSPTLVKYEMPNRGGAVRRLNRHGGGGQWRPALQSIAELGTA